MLVLFWTCCDRGFPHTSQTSSSISAIFSLSPFFPIPLPLIPVARPPTSLLPYRVNFTFSFDLLLRELPRPTIRSAMSGHSFSSRPMDLDNSTSAASTAYSPNQAPTSSSPSSPPSLIHSAPSPGTPAPRKRSDGNQTSTSVNNALPRPAIGHAVWRAQQLTRPSESDYQIFERDLLDPDNARIAATAMRDFLAAMEKAVTPPATRVYDSRENLQAFLIQMQLVAGIPVEDIRPMPEFAPKPNNDLVRRVEVPAFLTITNEGTFVPELPPVQFNGIVDPLPVNAGLPNPTWVSRAVENFRREMDNNAASSTTIVNTSAPQPTHGMMGPNNADPQTAKKEADFLTYFSSNNEQELITQFFAEHFSTGSSILNGELAKADELMDDDTDSDYATDYWSDNDG